MLVASGLVKHYGGVTALDGVGITLDAGRCTRSSARTARASPPS